MNWKRERSVERNWRRKMIWIRGRKQCKVTEFQSRVGEKGGKRHSKEWVQIYFWNKVRDMETIQRNKVKQFSKKKKKMRGKQGKKRTVETANKQVSERARGRGGGGMLAVFSGDCGGRRCDSTGCSLCPRRRWLPRVWGSGEGGRSARQRKHNQFTRHRQILIGHRFLRCLEMRLHIWRHPIPYILSPPNG